MPTAAWIVAFSAADQEGRNYVIRLMHEAGFEVAQVLHERGAATRHPIEVVVF